MVAMAMQGHLLQEVAAVAHKLLVAMHLLEEVVQVEGIQKEPPPLVLVDPGLLPTHLQMKVIFWIPQRIKQGLLASEVRMRVLKRMRKDGVPLPQVKAI